MSSYESTLFLATRHIQFKTHCFDFESENCTETGADQTNRQR